MCSAFWQSKLVVPAPNGIISLKGDVVTDAVLQEFRFSLVYIW